MSGYAGNPPPPPAPRSPWASSSPATQTAPCRGTAPLPWESNRCVLRFNKETFFSDRRSQFLFRIFSIACASAPPSRSHSNASVELAAILTPARLHPIPGATVPAHHSFESPGDTSLSGLDRAGGFVRNGATGFNLCGLGGKMGSFGNLVIWSDSFGDGRTLVATVTHPNSGLARLSKQVRYTSLKRMG